MDEWMPLKAILSAGGGACPTQTFVVALFHTAESSSHLFNNEFPILFISQISTGWQQRMIYQI